MQEGWRAAIAERARRELADKEAAIRERAARERDEEIEVRGGVGEEEEAEKEGPIVDSWEHLEVWGLHFRQQLLPLQLGPLPTTLPLPPPHNPPSCRTPHRRCATPSLSPHCLCLPPLMSHSTQAVVLRLESENAFALEAARAEWRQREEGLVVKQAAVVKEAKRAEER